MSEGTSIQTMRVPALIKQFLASTTAAIARAVLGVGDSLYWLASTDGNAWFDSAAPGAGTWKTETFTGCGLPAGTKAIVLTVALASGGADNLRWRAYGSSATHANSFRRTLVVNGEAGTRGGQAVVPVDAGFRVDFAVGGAGNTLNIGYPIAYYL